MKLRREVHARDIQTDQRGDPPIQDREGDRNPRLAIEHFVQVAVAGIVVIVGVSLEAFFDEQNPIDLTEHMASAVKGLRTVPARGERGRRRGRCKVRGRDEDKRRARSPRRRGRDPRPARDGGGAEIRDCRRTTHAPVNAPCTVVLLVGPARIRRGGPGRQAEPCASNGPRNCIVRGGKEREEGKRRRKTDPRSRRRRLGNLNASRLPLLPSSLFPLPFLTDFWTLSSSRVKRPGCSRFDGESSTGDRVRAGPSGQSRRRVPAREERTSSRRDSRRVVRRNARR